MYSRGSGRKYRRLVPLRTGDETADRLLALETPGMSWSAHSGEDEDDLCEALCCREDEAGNPVCCCCAPSSSASSSGEGLSCSLLLTSRLGRLLLVLTSMIIIYCICFALSYSSESSQVFGEEITPAHANVNVTRAREVLSQLCQAYDRQEVSGDACNRLCYKRDWHIADYYEGNKVVIVVKEGGQQSVFKSTLSSIDKYEGPPAHVNNTAFIQMVLDKVNEELMLGWPADLHTHLLGVLWPSFVRSGGDSLSLADRRSLWALMQQPEFLTFRIIPLSRVTPKIIGSCGHMYESESLVAFKMKGYYINLKGKILVHLMGTLKLMYEFLNEPLQWCDVQFDNLGLSAEYPKRFVVMDGDNLYTESRLKKLLTSKSCKTDADCTIGDCSSRCTANFTCSPRYNENLDVFCQQLVNKLFGNVWSKSNKYLAACHDTTTNFTQKLNDLRLTWSWTLSDV